jgi:S1-C subfamily serine protease
MIAETPPGTMATATVVRGGQRLDLEIRVAELRDAEDQKRPPKHEHAPTGLGLELRDSSVGPFGARGAVVAGVDPDGRAAGLLAPGDVILEVDHQTVRDAGDARRRIQRGHGAILLRVRRRDELIWVALPGR